MNQISEYEESVLVSGISEAIEGGGGTWPNRYPLREFMPEMRHTVFTKCFPNKHFIHCLSQICPCPVINETSRLTKIDICQYDDINFHQCALKARPSSHTLQPKEISSFCFYSTWVGYLIFQLLVMAIFQLMAVSSKDVMTQHKKTRTNSPKCNLYFFAYLFSLWKKSCKNHVFMCCQTLNERKVIENETKTNLVFFSNFLNNFWRKYIQVFLWWVTNKAWKFHQNDDHETTMIHVVDLYAGSAVNGIRVVNNMADSKLSC
jgi:hypothetical protein